MHAGYLLATGAAGYRGANYDRAIYLRGTEGAITYQFDTPVVLESTAPTWRHASPRTFDFALPSSPDYGGLHGLDFMRAFLFAEPETATPSGALDALRVLETLDAIYEAGRSGTTTQVNHRPSR